MSTQSRIWFTIVGLCLAMFLLFPPNIAATDLFVDCTGSTPNVGTNLQSAIDSLDLVGPHTIHFLGGPCVENIWIIDRQRLTITAEGIGAFIDSEHHGPAMYIAGSTGIRLVQIGFTNGNFGLLIERASEVSLEGCTIGGGNGNGVVVRGNSSVSLNGLVTGSATNGITVVDSQIAIGGGTIQNNGRYGLVLRKSHGVIGGDTGSPLVIQGNGSGLGVTASTLEVYGPVNIQNNTTGMNVLNGGSASLYGDEENAIMIAGNSWTGINTDGGFVSLAGGIHIINNGFGMQPLHAGVRVDDNTTLVASDAEISGNTGPGIDAINAGVISLGASVVSNNSADGIRLVGNSSVTFYPPNDNVVSGNGGLALDCDGTSVFSGDRTGVGAIACNYSPINDKNARSMKNKMVPADNERLLNPIKPSKQ